ncbi:MAG: hypothetical protein KGL75_10665 [Acidobacteriota bacterium]|nr:hypothetical protein [Acidobacteriota bacterium]
MADRLDVKPEADWYGFTFNKNRVLFRYGKPEPPRAGYSYEDRPIFHYPFGDDADQRRAKHFVLLHAEVSKNSEYFFVVPISAAEALATEYPKRTLRLTTENNCLAKVITEKLQPYKCKSLDEVKRALQ